VAAQTKFGVHFNHERVIGTKNVLRSFSRKDIAATNHARRKKRQNTIFSYLLRFGPCSSATRSRGALQEALSP